MKILLVDDDVIICKGMRKIIEQSHLQCTVLGEVSDGELALEFLKCHPYVNLIITDIRMPIMDGLELIKAIRKENMHIHIIVLSGFDDFEYVRTAFIDNVVDYLLKPIEPNKLIDTLQKAQKAIEEKIVQQQLQFIMVSNTIQDIVKENYSIQENIKTLTKLDVSLHQYHLVIIFKLDYDYLSKPSVEDSLNYLKQLAFITSERFSLNATISCYYFISNNELSFFIFSSTLNVLEQVKLNLPSLLNNPISENTTYTVGISMIEFGEEKIKTNFSNALEAVNLRFYNGKNSHIYYKLNSFTSSHTEYNAKNHLSIILTALEMHDYASLKSALEDIFSHLKYIDSKSFKSKIIDLFQMIFLSLPEFKSIISASQSNYLSYIEDINTYNELLTFTHSLLYNAITIMKKEQLNKPKRKIETAKKYILKNYMYGITLNDLADYVDLNPSYFSNLFKKEFGVNFSDFLLEVRINAAKALLKDTHLKIYEISTEIGYEDTISFGRAFKKKVGISPKEYRNLIH